ncbi:hypothetical protein Arth_0175 [Arthrobacter sp. FB24]|jgi:hypothetical protein|uniref:hypothetical protein n=1 Tax=Arthrobacter sp. (strain FB24) TaxID=290399 RepID=UPI0000527896|nr:hypothetical protein [Arthrobacter sp. FB24]ABK01576.1 hypothetical protein Arth_0175 [Arthrobacter sp. FB24]
MRSLGVFLVAVTTSLIPSACLPEAVPCPAIAQAPVVALTVAASYASTVKAIHLKACQDGTCREADLELMPGSTAVDQGCEPSSGPDGTCSATSSPDGTLTGMLMMDILTESRIDATATGTSTAGAPLPERTLSFMPRAEYPYGEQCGKFITASLLLDAEGLRQAE